MKFLSLLILFPALSFGQIQEVRHNSFTPVGSIIRGGGSSPSVSLEVSVAGNDTMYVLRFEDATFQSPVFSNSQPFKESVYFKNIENTIGKLYDLLMNVFTEKQYESKDYETIFILGTRTVVVRRDFYADKTRVQFIVDGRMFAIRNLKELDRLFGKSK